MTPPDTDITAVNSTSTFLTANGSTVLTCPVSAAVLHGETISSSPTTPSATLVTDVTGTFTDCTSLGGSVYTANVHEGHLVGSIYTPGSNPPTTGVTSGALEGISASITGPNGCTIDLMGIVPGKYYNSTNTLSAPGTTSELTIGPVTGTPCTNLVVSGEHAGFRGTFHVMPPVTISYT